jgi:hypothetical protein
MKSPKTAFVVKIQRALNDPTAPALVYNQNRSIYIQVPWEDVKGLFQPDEVKIFCRAKVEPGQGFKLLGEKVPDPGW